MATASDLVEETRRWLDSGGRPELNRLNGAITDTDTTLTLEFTMGSVVAGAVLALELEHVYVWSVSGQTATVQRAWGGTTAAAHADDTIAYVNPRWSNFTILSALNEELAALSSPVNGLYQMKTVEVTYSPAVAGYDLTAVTDLLEIYDVRTDTYGPAKDWPRLNRWILARNQNTTVFPSSLALQLFEGGYPGKAIRVQYKAPFTTFSTLASTVADTGLAATAADIPPLGALVRLVAPREIKRSVTDAQPESRVAAEVPPGTSRSTAAGLMALRQMRIKEESARLARTYPPYTRRSA